MRPKWILLFSLLLSCTEEKTPHNRGLNINYDPGHYTEVVVTFSSDLPETLSIRADDQWVADNQSREHPCTEVFDQVSDYYFEKVSARELKISNHRGVGCGSKTLKLSVHAGECQIAENNVLFEIKDYADIKSSGFKLLGIPPSKDQWCPIVELQYVQQ